MSGAEITDSVPGRGTGETAVRPFGVRLRAAMDAHGPLCAGIDPHRGLVESWGLTYDLAGVERFALTCVEAFAGTVAAVKPQSAFFEVFGAAGVALLERVVDELRAAGTLTILDAKRGDVGTTMDAYAEAFLGKDAPSPADALTVSPYLGYGSLRPAVDLALQTGRGVFVLALTSNPEGPSVQHAVRDGRSVAATVVDGVAADNAPARERGSSAASGWSSGRPSGRPSTTSASTWPPRALRCSPRGSGHRGAPPRASARPSERLWRRCSRAAAAASSPPVPTPGHCAMRCVARPPACAPSWPDPRARPVPPWCETCWVTRVGSAAVSRSAAGPAGRYSP